MVVALIVTSEPALAVHDTKAVTLATLLLAASFYGTLGFYALSAVALLGAIAAASVCGSCAPRLARRS